MDNPKNAVKVGLGLAGPARSHVGMAFALGYIKAALTLIEHDPT